MTPGTRYERLADVAVIRLENPPVNGLAHRVRQGIAAGLEKAHSEDAVRSIVLIGDGKLFSGGADIREFKTPAASDAPSLRDVIERVEASSKPVIAAVHGGAYGGGLELAMGCNYRVASASTQLALPEVKLGLLPGAGGTQRLPRLVGAKAALEMIVSGDPIDAIRARELGLIDGIIDGDFLAGAIAFAKRVASAPQHPVASRRTIAPMDGDAIFAAARSEAARTRRGFLAPLECIACVEAALSLPFDQGLVFERERFKILLNGAQSKALRHLFFAEREAAKVADLPPDTATRPIGGVGVVGAGTMGTGIAMSFANAGFAVTLLESRSDALQRASSAMRSSYAASVAKGKLDQARMERRLELIAGSLDYADLREADLVIEAVFEDMSVKHAVFERLDAICKPGAILATNTSRLNVDEIAARTSRPQDVIGLHFFSPANVMRLLEIVRAAKTAPDVIATSIQLARKLGKIAAVVGVCEGFVGNRMLTPYLREAGFLLEEGASPQQVDRALVEFGMAMGPFAVSDLAGLDIGWQARKRLAASRPKHLRYSTLADRLCEMGRFGQKTGAGYYRYAPGTRTPLPDPEVDSLIERCAGESGTRRRAIGDHEIVERTLFALINEGARILDEGIAQRASDIDLIYVHGYGFPAWRGGPIYYADALGLDKVLARVRQFREAHDEHWAPAPLLERLAAQGNRFNRD
jgi:3-hydroxyacyl-CoA dehydrogenase